MYYCTCKSLMSNSKYFPKTKFIRTHSQREKIFIQINATVFFLLDINVVNWQKINVNETVNLRTFYVLFEWDI